MGHVKVGMGECVGGACEGGDGRSCGDMDEDMQVDVFPVVRI